MNKEVYGTVSAPSAWRRTLVKALVQMGYQQSVTDSCVFLLKKTTCTEGRGENVSLSEQLAVELQEEALTGKEDEQKRRVANDSCVCDAFVPVSGLLSLLVDDLLEGGDAVHRANMETLKKRFSFGKHKSLMNTPGGAMFNGRRLQQLATFANQCTMRDYILEKIDPIALPTQHKKSEGPQPAPEVMSEAKDLKE
eukprot:5171190-Amphidinium_carterae.1